MSDNAVSVQNLRKAFGSKVVLDNVSFEVPQGQTFALLGRNGVGKTTLLKTLAGILPPLAGRVELTAANGAPPVLGYVPQRDNLDYTSAALRLSGNARAGAWQFRFNTLSRLEQDQVSHDTINRFDEFALS